MRISKGVKMWLNLLSLGVKTGARIYQNKQRTKQLMSDAQMLHADKNLPYWYQAIFIGVVSAIYGLKGADIMRKK